MDEYDEREGTVIVCASNSWLGPNFATVYRILLRNGSVRKKATKPS